MSEDDWPLLCFLFLDPDNRLVHSHAGQPDEDGHITFPDTVFIRIQKPGGGFSQVGKRMFRRVHKGGWLTRVNVIDMGVAGPQDEYQLSTAAKGRFKSDPQWQRELFLWRQALARMQRNRAAPLPHRLGAG